MKDFCILCGYSFKMENMVSVGYLKSMCVECAKVNLKPENQLTRKQKREKEEADDGLGT